MGMAMAGMTAELPGHARHGRMPTAPRPSAPPQPAARLRPGVDMLAAAPPPRLDDPGVGLRDNGRHVLTYGELHTLGGAIDAREPQREIELHLTGHMQRYMWSFDGRKFSQSRPLQLRYGERLRIVLVNDTMMTHPIHLHGMWSEVEDAARRVSAAQTHRDRAARAAPELSRDRRCARPLGLSLPPALSHGGRDVSRSRGGGATE